MGKSPWSTLSQMNSRKHQWEEFTGRHPSPQTSPVQSLSLKCHAPQFAAATIRVVGKNNGRKEQGKKERIPCFYPRSPIASRDLGDQNRPLQSLLFPFTTLNEC